MSVLLSHRMSRPLFFLLGKGRNGVITRHTGLTPIIGLADERYRKIIMKTCETGILRSGVLTGHSGLCAVVMHNDT